MVTAAVVVVEGVAAGVAIADVASGEILAL